MAISSTAIATPLQIQIPSMKWTSNLQAFEPSSLRLEAVELIPVGRLRWKFFRNCSNMARIGAKLCQNAFRTILNVWSFHAKQFFSAKFSDQNFRFSLIWRGFGRSTAERTSKSASTSNFALDRLILRSVRPKNPEFGSNLGSPKIFNRLKVSVSLEELFPQPHLYLHLYS